MSATSANALNASLAAAELAHDLVVCIFCLRCRGNLDLTSITTSKTGCTYGLGHEFPEPLHADLKPARKIDKQLCTRCGLHSKNPKSATTGCEHEYSE